MKTIIAIVAVTMALSVAGCNRKADNANQSTPPNSSSAPASH